MNRRTVDRRFAVNLLLYCSTAHLLCARLTEPSTGTPWRIRTSDLLVRSQALYPAELRGLVS